MRYVARAEGASSWAAPARWCTNWPVMTPPAARAEYVRPANPKACRLGLAGRTVAWLGYACAVQPRALLAIPGRYPTWWPSPSHTTGSSVGAVAVAVAVGVGVVWGVGDGADRVLHRPAWLHGQADGRVRVVVLEGVEEIGDGL